LRVETSTVENLMPHGWLRVAELVETYGDLDLGGVDTRLIAVVERLDVTEIGTLDIRDFAVVRARHVDAFMLLP